MPMKSSDLRFESGIQIFSRWNLVRAENTSFWLFQHFFQLFSLPKLLVRFYSCWLSTSSSIKMCYLPDVVAGNIFDCVDFHYNNNFYLSTKSPNSFSSCSKSACFCHFHDARCLKRPFAIIFVGYGPFLFT